MTGLRARAVPALLAGAVLAGSALPCGPARAETVAGTAKAVEGDTVSVNGTEIRLFGIDAPDRGQTCENVRGQSYDCFALSSLALERLIGGREVSCEIKPSVGTAKLGVCKVEGRDLAGMMVNAGWALAYRRIAQDYAAIEAQAISRRRGMWAGRVEPPWQWRSRRIGAKPETPDGG
ncbi:thermonuclease family protein [Rhodospirillum centenum]|uniref:Staphylococcal nuclease-like protein putative n=1 Tax=Rhodospirillum centenum (strain ATCC 51521 / SW) TaxID=414684 RepID=B6INA5_RHOCS|nr:thermonuclease family protein [Rhodospirillum centenum]ACI99002.1 staphylococcal nuclease-like protein putative [Rhodospirillum centenum SW]